MGNLGGELTHEQIAALYAKKPNKRDGHVEKVFDYLVANGPFDGNTYALAEAIGITRPNVQEALVYIRSNSDVLGWTVPYVKRGGFSSQQYAVVPTAGKMSSNEEQILRDGIDRRSVELVSALERVHKQSQIHLDITDGRTAEGRWARLVYATVGNLVIQGQAMLTPLTTNSK